MADLFAPLAGDKAEQLAGSLIAKFGGLSAATNAATDADDLTETEREALALLNAARNLTNATLTEGLASSAVQIDDPGLKRYLQVSLAMSSEEQLLAIFLDARGYFVRDETLAYGGLWNVALPMRALGRRAIELDARAVILAHNHPSGCDKPSARDCAVTTRVREALVSLEVALLDHLVVTRESVFSIRRGERI
jgi:DNA repair protein RadC